MNAQKIEGTIARIEILLQELKREIYNISEPAIMEKETIFPYDNDYDEVFSE